MIPVTKPFLPPKEEYQKYVDSIWQRNWLTNNGPLVNELEIQLKRYLDIKHLLFLGNGTIALQIAIRALGLKGKIITTPFSYVATTSSIVWEHCEPLFVDIDPHTLNMDASKIEGTIKDDVSGILATHCFGNACDVELINEIAQRNNLKVIYDAAHCFGTKYQGKSIFAYGNISTCSFHATKLFHTTEGGAVFTQDSDLLKKMAFMRNFGHKDYEKFSGLGINGKNSEFHAAMGLCNLEHVKDILSKRKEQSDIYDELLKPISFTKQAITEGCEYNYAYYPIILESENLALKMKEELSKREIFSRRYFYPSLSSLPYVTSTPTPVSDDVASRIICLPLYHELSREEQRVVSRVLLRTYNYLEL